MQAGLGKLAAQSVGAGMVLMKSRCSLSRSKAEVVGYWISQPRAVFRGQIVLSVYYFLAQPLPLQLCFEV